jgi:hypothetical protein
MLHSLLAMIDYVIHYGRETHKLLLIFLGAQEVRILVAAAMAQVVSATMCQISLNTRD